MTHPALVDERPSELLTVKQAAQVMNCSNSQIYTLFEMGLEYIMVGKRGKRIERAELQRYIDAHRRRGPIGGRSTNRWESQLDTEKGETAGLSRKRATVSALRQRLEAKERPDSSQQDRKAS